MRKIFLFLSCHVCFEYEQKEGNSQSLAIAIKVKVKALLKTAWLTNTFQDQTKLLSQTSTRLPDNNDYS